MFARLCVCVCARARARAMFIWIQVYVPMRQAEAGTFLIFICVSSLCSFLLLGLFVAVVTNTFKRVRQKYGAGFLSDEQVCSAKP